MPRKKAKNQDELLTHNIVIRVTEIVFNRLEKMRIESDSLSVAEVVRKILANRKIKIFH